MAVGILLVAIWALYFSNPLATARNTQIFGQITLALVFLSYVFRPLQIRFNVRRWAVSTLFLITSVPLFLLVGIRGVTGSIEPDAILFHMQFGISGYATRAALFTSLSTFVGWLGLTYIVATYIFSERYRTSVTTALLMAILLANPMLAYVAQSFGLGLQSSAGEPLPELADLNRPATNSPIAKVGKNLVLIYLEGLEQTYGNVTAFGDTYADIAALQTEGVVFSDIAQTAFSGWSIAGMVAGQCGIPLLRDGAIFGNNYDSGQPFFSGARCLGDVLRDAGYSMEFIVGSDAEFGGISRFYRDHGFNKITDISQDYAPTALNDWGAFDGAVFASARRSIARLEANGQPFALVLETNGPHGPTGFVAPECAADGKGFETQDILPSVRCTAGLARNFVEYLRANVDMDNTLVVVLSDHLAHKNNVSDALESLKRRDTAIFIGAELQQRRIDKKGAIIDLFPTILSVLGYPPLNGRAGLGVSLLTSHPGLIERLGPERLDILLRSDRLFARTLWNPDSQP